MSEMQNKQIARRRFLEFTGKTMVVAGLGAIMTLTELTPNAMSCCTCQCVGYCPTDVCDCPCVGYNPCPCEEYVPPCNCDPIDCPCESNVPCYTGDLWP